MKNSYLRPRLILRKNISQIFSSHYVLEKKNTFIGHSFISSLNFTPENRLFLEVNKSQKTEHLFEKNAFILKNFTLVIKKH